MVTARTRGMELEASKELLLTGVVEEEEEAGVAEGVVEGVVVAGVEVEVLQEEQTVSVFREF